MSDETSDLANYVYTYTCEGVARVEELPSVKYADAELAMSYVTNNKADAGTDVWMLRNGRWHMRTTAPMSTITPGTGGVEWQAETVTLDDDTRWYVRKSYAYMGECHYEVAMTLEIDGVPAKVWWPVAVTPDHGLSWKELIPQAVRAATTWCPECWASSVLPDTVPPTS